MRRKVRTATLQPLVPWQCEGIFVFGNAFVNSIFQPLFDRLALAAVGLWAWFTQIPALLFYLELSLPEGRLPALGLPRTVDDKYLWRKLIDHDPLFTILCDKVAVKAWVGENFPDIATAPLLWVGADPDNLPAAVLAGNVAVKANHGCGTNLFIRDGIHDRAAVIATAQRWLTVNHGKLRQEWGYANIPRRILVEPLMMDASAPLQELKYYTFGDQITRMVQIVGRHDGQMEACVYEPDAANRLLLLTTPAEVSPILYQGGLPATAARAEAQARRLGAGLDHVRVDFLTNGDELWLGEMTLYNLAGRMSRGGQDPNHPTARAWDLRRAHFLRNPPQTGWRAIYARALLRTLDRKAADAAAKRSILT